MNFDKLIEIIHYKIIWFNKVLIDTYLCNKFNFPAKDKMVEELPRGLMGRMLGAVADRGRVLTARLVLPPTQA